MNLSLLCRGGDGRMCSLDAYRPPGCPDPLGCGPCTRAGYLNKARCLYTRFRYWFRGYIRA